MTTDNYFITSGGCGEGSYNGPSGVITSPNYPDNYPNNLKCQYYIIASAESSISIIFEHFDLEDDKDYVTVCFSSISFLSTSYCIVFYLTAKFAKISLYTDAKFELSNIINYELFNRSYDMIS